MTSMSSNPDEEPFKKDISLPSADDDLYYSKLEREHKSFMETQRLEYSFYCRVLMSLDNPKHYSWAGGGLPLEREKALEVIDQIKPLKDAIKKFVRYWEDSLLRESVDLIKFDKSLTDSNFRAFKGQGDGFVVGVFFVEGIVYKIDFQSSFGKEASESIQITDFKSASNYPDNTEDRVEITGCSCNIALGSELILSAIQSFPSLEPYAPNDHGSFFRHYKL